MTTPDLSENRDHDPGADEDAEIVAALRRSGMPPELRRRLAADAAAAGVLDATYATTDSPIGALLMAASPRGLVRLAFAGEDHGAVVADLAKRLGPRILHDERALEPVARELDEYFAGRRKAFDLAVDLVLATPFRRAVLEALTEIPYGTTTSYAALARAAGNPAAVRAAGSACATNPVPLVVPCHRVLRSDGSIGGYGGGLDTKRLLLRLEGAPLPA